MLSKSELFDVFRYGIGMIYYKQEKFALAEVHFRKALSINPQNSVLLCHIGVVSAVPSVIIPHLWARSDCNGGRILSKYVMGTQKSCNGGSKQFM